MPIDRKYVVKGSSLLRDARPVHIRIADWLTTPDNTVFVFGFGIVLLFVADFSPGAPLLQGAWDFWLLLGIFYFRWLKKRDFKLPFKMPLYAAQDGMKDPNNKNPGPNKGKAMGIMYLGNDRSSKEEIWVSAQDATTHILFLSTTGGGKSEGLKGFATNALSWGSGFVFVDGKADTSMWGSLYSLCRRFGRDDDLFVINYMTANSDAGGLSNSMNPFSAGSASYLVQLLTQLMPESGGDNAMWKERAVALISALMPAMTYLRDNHNVLLDIGTIRDNIELPAVIRFSRDQRLPKKILTGVKSYLDTLPGYVDDAFDDEGKEKPPSPDSPVYDLSVARQQHGYLSMQFTRSLQSLADEYGYIFKAQLADVDVIDLVLNRRIMVVLIPALEKSADEASNLGKIVAATLKGMMGAALGAQVEGSWESAIENKSTNAPSPYMVIFDEVGYYTSPGMAVMAAQARSLGFSLVFTSQDLPSMQKRIKEEARSIAGNCNIKIFGKLEDPTETKTFFESTVGSDNAFQSKNFQTKAENVFGTYHDTLSAGLESKKWASYDDLREQREGEVHILFSEWPAKANTFFVDTGKTRALRVQKLLGVPGVTKESESRERQAADIGRHLMDKNWSLPQGEVDATGAIELATALATFQIARGQKNMGSLDAAKAAVAKAQTAVTATPAAAPAEHAPAATAAAAPVAPSKAGAGPVTKVAPPVATATASTERRAATSAAGVPSEQDVMRSAAATKSAPLPPFELPKPDAALTQRLQDLGRRLSKGLSGGTDREAAE